MSLDAEALASVLLRVGRRLRSAADELNALDATVGDGDLGTTLARCADALERTPLDPSSVAGVLQEAGKRCSAACGSSFGTLLGAALRAAAREAPDAALPRRLHDDDIARLLDRAATAVAQLGEAREGDKTMLDAMLAAVRSRPADGSAWTPAHACGAVRTALDAMRPLPGKVGRARLHAARAGGYDDPGMVAVLRMVEAV